MKETGELRPGSYSEFRCASREHSGLAWGAIFDKMSKFQNNAHVLKMDMSNISRNRNFSGTIAQQGASRQKGALQDQKMKL